MGKTFANVDNEKAKQQTNKIVNEMNFKSLFFHGSSESLRHNLIRENVH